MPLVTRAEGAILHTADAISSWWVTTHGHNHPRIVAAIRDQAERLDQIIFAGWTHAPAEDLARGLTAIMPPALTRVFFSDSLRARPPPARLLRDRDLLLRPLGNTVYVMPPYGIGADDLARVHAAIGEAADKI